MECAGAASRATVWATATIANRAGVAVLAVCAAEHFLKQLAWIDMRDFSCAEPIDGGVMNCAGCDGGVIRSRVASLFDAAETSGSMVHRLADYLAQAPKPARAR